MTRKQRLLVRSKWKRSRGGSHRKNIYPYPLRRPASVCHARAARWLSNCPAMIGGVVRHPAMRPPLQRVIVRSLQQGVPIYSGASSPGIPYMQQSACIMAEQGETSARCTDSNWMTALRLTDRHIQCATGRKTFRSLQVQPANTPKQAPPHFLTIFATSDPWL